MTTQRAEQLMHQASDEATREAQKVIRDHALHLTSLTPDDRCASQGAERSAVEAYLQSIPQAYTLQKILDHALIATNPYTNLRSLIRGEISKRETSITAVSAPKADAIPREVVLGEDALEHLAR